MEPVTSDSRYGDARVYVAVGSFTVELGGGSLVRGEYRGMGEWNEGN